MESIIKSNTDIVQDYELYRNPVTHKLRTGTGRINAYKALQEIENIGQNYFICDSSEVIWNDPVYVKDTIRICLGSTLRVRSDVFFRPSARVIVECGGKLIVDGGRLTGTNNHLWKGVLAYSNSSEMQNPIDQSVVSVQNGGIIELAETGIASVHPGYDPDNPTYTNGGALIMCNKGIFQNNLISVKLNPYKLTSLSRFIGCQFINERNELQFKDTLDCFVHLYGVSGVQFRGCTFTNNTAEPIGHGIYSFNSAFSVYDYICDSITPCYDTIPSSFKNLLYGVYSLSAGSIYSPIIHNVIFEDNLTSAYISGTTGFTFTNNIIKVRDDSTDVTESHYCGLYLDASTAYEVSENTFYYPTYPTQNYFNKVGIIVNNSGPENNTLYLNTFTNLTHGIHAQGENRNRTGSTGLEIKCNTFNNCNTDISVYSKTSGIKQEQGSLGTLPTDAAGNEFSKLTTSGYWSIYNDALWINYNFHLCALSSRLRPGNVFQVTPHMGWVVYSSESCPPSSGGEETKDQLVSGINENKMQAEILSSELNLLVDLNNTPLVVNDIISSIPEDSTLVFNELVEISPYVSDTVIFESIKKEDVFSNIKIHDLIKLNSHASKLGKIINEIDNRQIYMPDSMYYAILRFADSISGKEILEGNISAKLRDASRYFKSYYQLNLRDSTFSEGFIDTLDIINLFEAKVLKAAFFLNSNHYESALNEIESLIDSELATGYETKCEDFLSYYSVCSQYGFDNIPDTILLSLYNSNDKLSTAFYRNMLINRGLIEYREPYQFPSLMKSDKIRKNRVETPKVSLESCLRIYPNPANDYLVLEYLFPEKVETASIRIMDIFGKVINSFSMSPKSGKRNINVDNLSPGIYLLESLTNDGIKETVKFNIIN